MNENIVSDASQAYHHSFGQPEITGFKLTADALYDVTNNGGEQQNGFTDLPVTISISKDRKIGGPFAKLQGQTRQLIKF